MSSRVAKTCARERPIPQAPRAQRAGYNTDSGQALPCKRPAYISTYRTVLSGPWSVDHLQVASCVALCSPHSSSQSTRASLRTLLCLLLCAVLYGHGDWSKRVPTSVAKGAGCAQQSLKSESAGCQGHISTAITLRPQAYLCVGRRISGAARLLLVHLRMPMWKRTATAATRAKLDQLGCAKWPAACPLCACWM